jgi:hypothetical protein
MSEISVTVVGSTTINPTVGNGDTVNVTIASSGERGPSGSTGPAGPANTLTIGTVTQGTAAATITGTAPSQVLNLVLQKGDAGTNIELQATGTHIQWRLVGASTWTNLVALSSITGLTGSSGAAGAAVELQASGTHIQWRYVGDSTWTNVVALSSLVGATGATGATGPQGPAGSVNLADETPQPLGTASAGTALSAARADHVHAQGSISYSGLTGIPSTFTPSAHSHAVADVTGLQTALDGKQASGSYATLVGGTVPSSQLPSYVDDVIEYANLAAFTEQSTGKIYVARDTGKIYRWSGSAYVEISPSPGSTDSVTEGSTNLYYTNTRAAAAAPVQSVAGRTGAVALTKIDVGLSNVTNTDATARSNHTGTQLASTISDFATEAAKYGPVTSVSGRTGTITLTKSDVGLSSVDNTADTAKPISTATQTALDGKAATSHTHSLANITQSSATTGQVPTWNGSAWAAATPSGGGGSANIVERAATSDFPRPGAIGTIYISTYANRAFRYDSSGVYVEIGAGGPNTTFTAPSAPTAVTGVAGNGQVTLSWTVPSNDGGATIDRYAIQYSSDGGTTWTLFARSTSSWPGDIVTGLTNGVAYVFRVIAGNTAVGSGDWSTVSSPVTPTGFTASAVILTSGTSYTVPSGATSMKVWAVGPGGMDGSAYGHAGAVCYKTWSVSGGQSISYSLGANATYESGAQRSGSTTVTFSGTTITAQGGGGNSGSSSPASFSGGDGGATGGLGGGSYANWSGGAVGGNGTLTACGRYQATDVSGLFAAVTLAGGTVSETCGATAAFGSGGYGAQTSGVLYGIGGGGAWNQNNAASDNGGQGAVVIYFS